MYVCLEAFILIIFKSNSLYRVTWLFSELSRCIIRDELVKLILLLAVPQIRKLELGSVLLWKKMDNQYHCPLEFWFGSIYVFFYSEKIFFLTTFCLIIHVILYLYICFNLLLSQSKKDVSSIALDAVKRTTNEAGTYSLHGLSMPFKRWPFSRYVFKT